MVICKGNQVGTGFGNQTRRLSVVCFEGVLGVSMIRFCRDQCSSSSFLWITPLAGYTGGIDDDRSVGFRLGI